MVFVAYNEKLSEKLKAHKKYDFIKFALNNVVYNFLSLHEFENSWDLYEEKHRWVPIYVKDSFWVGMLITQRSENMNSFFDGYVNSKITLKQFIEQYENALASKVSKENQEDFNSYNLMYPYIFNLSTRTQNLRNFSKK